jgi:hypothetical protein
VPRNGGTLTVHAVQHGTEVDRIEPLPLLAGIRGSQGGPVTGTALIARWHLDGEPDVFAAFTRADGPGHRWHQVTGEVTEEQALNWRENRTGYAMLGARLEAWLDASAEAAR